MRFWAAIIVLSFALIASAENEFIWENPGQDPFTGDIKEAVAKFPMSEKAKAELIEKIKSGQYRLGTFHPGEKCDFMAFGKNRMIPRVVYEPSPKIENPILETRFYEVNDEGVKYVIAQPVICNNLCFYRVELDVVKKAPSASVSPQAPPVQKTPPLPPPPTPSVPKTPPIIEVSPSPEEEHVVKIMLWVYGEVTKKLSRVDGLQSRDLGNELLKARAEGKAELSSKCGTFQVVFIDFNYDKMRGKRVRINGEEFIFPENFGKFDWKAFKNINTISVKVCGEASFGIKPEWVNKRSALVVYADKSLLPLHYPPSGRLTKCSGRGNDEGKCGRAWSGEYGELYQEVIIKKFNNSDAHFVLSPE